MSYPAFDTSSQDYKRNPYPTLAAMREAGPIVRIRYPLVGSFLAVTPYDAACELLREPHTFVRDPRSAGMKKGANLPWWIPRSLRAMGDSMIIRDEPDHRRLRSLVEQAFVRRNVEQLRPRFEQMADEMISELAAEQRRSGKPVDLVAGLARPFPLAVICELLGLPQADRPLFVAHAEAMSRGPSLLGAFGLLRGIGHVVKYTRDQIQQARRTPREGLISALVAAEYDGKRLSEDEMLAMIVLLLFAGHLTTVHLIGAGIYTLLTQPEQKQSLLADWSQRTLAVNELLRYLSPVQTTKPMSPVRDLEWRGQRLMRGKRIVAMLAAANADPQQFAEPERLDLRRDPNPHVAFGTGPHVCLGWKLAVVEAEVALERLFTRFPNLALAVPAAEVRWSNQPGTRGVETLMVELVQ